MKMKLNGINYDYQIYGKGEPILLLHGFIGSQKTWSNIINPLSKQFQVITIDLIGHGNTESPYDVNLYQMEAVVDQLDELLKQLKIDQVNILGYSMGGRVALSFTCLKQDRVKKLILESASPGILDEKEREDRKKHDFQLAQKILKDGIESFVNEWEKLPLFKSQKQLPEGVQKQIRLSRLNQNKMGLANSLIGMGTGSQPSWWEHLQKIEIPVKIVVGQLDHKFCNIGEEMGLKLQHASISTVPNVGHAPHIEEPEKFAKIVMEFLQD